MAESCRKKGIPDASILQEHQHHLHHHPHQWTMFFFQATMTAIVTAAMVPMSNNGWGGGINSSTNGQHQGRSAECTYEDFTNSKLISFNRTGGVIALS